MQGMEVVFHAAAYYPSRRDRRPLAEQLRYGVQQTQAVVKAASLAGINRFIFTSTLTTIGSPPIGENRLANEKDDYQPGSVAKSAYYETKYAMEQVVLAAAKNGLPSMVLNPTAVFGPGDVHLTMGRLLLAVARGQVMTWLPGSINVVDVREVAYAHIQAVTHGMLGERYIIGGHNLSIREAINLIARCAGVRPPRIEIPAWLIDSVIAIDDALPFVNLTGNHLRGFRHWQGYDTTKAQKVFSLESRPFDQTVRDALLWFKEQGYLSI
jgi:dihydroflavonol-4-reductase